MAISGDVVLDPAVVLIELGKLGKWLQAIGLVVIIWIIVQLINLFLNRKKREMIEKMKVSLGRVEKKLDLLMRKQKK